MRACRCSQWKKLRSSLVGVFHLCLLEAFVCVCACLHVCLIKTRKGERFVADQIKFCVWKSWVRLKAAAAAAAARLQAAGMSWVLVLQHNTKMDKRIRPHKHTVNVFKKKSYEILCVLPGPCCFVLAIIHLTRQHFIRDLRESRGFCHLEPSVCPPGFGSFPLASGSMPPSTAFSSWKQTETHFLWERTGHQPPKDQKYMFFLLQGERKKTLCPAVNHENPLKLHHIWTKKIRSIRTKMYICVIRTA